MLTDPYLDQDPIDEMSFQGHFSGFRGTSLEAKKCQFLMDSEPLWAWVCSVLDRQDGIKELLN
jgi:hypothetical protein